MTPLLRKAGVQPPHSQPRFCAVLFPRAEAEAAIARYLAEEADKATAAEADNEPRLKSRHACKVLGCVDLMLIQLRKAGLIEAERDWKSYVYRKSEPERFRRRYIFGAELGEMIGRPGVGGGKAMTAVVLGLGDLLAT